MVEVVCLNSVGSNLWWGLICISASSYQRVDFSALYHLSHGHIHETTSLIILFLRSPSPLFHSQGVACVIWGWRVVIWDTSVGSLLYNEFVLLYRDLMRLQVRLRAHHRIAKLIIHCIWFWIHLNENILCDSLIVIMLNWWPLVL